MSLLAQPNRLYRTVGTGVRIPGSLQAVLATVICLLALARPAAAQYYYEDWTAVNVPPVHVRISSIGPNKLTVAWDYSDMGGTTSATFYVWRNGQNVQTTTNHFWVDMSYTGGTQQIQYAVQLVGDANVDPRLPPPPPGTPDNEIDHLYYNSNRDQVAINVNLVRSVATDNQSVDSRIDPRYSTTVYQNFPFGAAIYKGGLFAGYAADSAKVGRTYLKFQLSTLAPGTPLWTASLFGFFTCSATNGSVTVGSQGTATNWTETSINWSNAPVVDPSKYHDQQTVTYNGLITDEKWASWNIAGEVANTVFGTGALSIALTSTSETSNGWAYFAKRQWVGGWLSIDTKPYVIYAYGSPLWPLSLWFDPGQPVAGTTATGTLTMTAPAPTGGISVTLGSDNGLIATVPTSVTVPAGQTSVTFTVTAVSGGTANITASYAGYTITVPITVTGGGCGGGHGGH